MFKSNIFCLAHTNTQASNSSKSHCVDTSPQLGYVWNQKFLVFDIIMTFQSGLRTQEIPKNTHSLMRNPFLHLWRYYQRSSDAYSSTFCSGYSCTHWGRSWRACWRVLYSAVIPSCPLPHEGPVGCEHQGQWWCSPASPQAKAETLPYWMSWGPGLSYCQLIHSLIQLTDAVWPLASSVGQVAWAALKP